MNLVHFLHSKKLFLFLAFIFGFLVSAIPLSFSIHFIVRGIVDAPFSCGPGLECTHVLSDYSIPAISGLSAVEQHCAFGDQLNLPYCEALAKHYETTDVSSGGDFDNGIAFSSVCQLSSADIETLKKDPANQDKAYKLYGWNSPEPPSCYDGWYVYSGYTETGCTPPPVGTCALINIKPVSPEEEKYYITMRWQKDGKASYSTNVFVRDQKVFVKNTEKNVCAIAVPLEYGPSVGTGKVAGFAPELAQSLQHQDGTQYEYSWVINPEDAPIGPVPCLSEPSEPPPPPPPPIPYPDLTLIPSSITMNYSYKKWGTYYYTITLEVENKGGKVATEGEVCFKRNIWYSFLCGDAVSIGTLQAGETKKISLTINSFWKLDNNPVGTLKIRNVYPQESDTQNNSYDIAESLVLALAPDPGGVDFTFTELTGMAIDPKNGNIKFVMKSEEAGLDDPVIDLEGEQTLLKKIFLQALAIPNEKHWISLEANYDNWDGQGMPPGYALVPSPLEQTEIAEIMLAADVELKFDHAESTPFLNIIEMWTNLVKQSPYWAEIQASGFQDYPDPFQRKIYIAPGNITANQTDATIFFTDIDLDLKAEWGDTLPTLNLSKYTLSQAAKEDLLQRLNQHIDEADQMLKNHALELEANMFDVDPGLLKEPYKKLKSVYTAIAAAQWYKKQVAFNPSLPYANLVDSEELEEIKTQTPFDKSYWDSQAIQFLKMDTCTYFGGQGDCGFHGSVEFEDGTAMISQSLDMNQQEIIEKTVEDFEDVVEGETVYSSGGEPTAVLADIAVGSIGTQEPYYIAGKTYLFSLEIENQGPIGVPSFPITVSDTLVLPSGESKIVSLGSWTGDGFEPWSGREETFSITLPIEEGKHRLTFQADANGELVEITGANNVASIRIDVQSNTPMLTIHSPNNGSSIHTSTIQDGLFHLSATAIHPEYGDLSSSINWSSSVDGALGIGSVLTPISLSPGIHTITAMASIGEITITQKRSIFVYSDEMTQNGILTTNFESGKQVRVSTDNGIAWIPSTKFSALSTGGYHNCGIYDTSIYCWGTNNFGQLGIGNAMDVSIPTKVSDGQLWGGNIGVSAVTTGAYHTCALKDGSVYCWGNNNYGQLGLGGPTSAQVVPKGVADGSILEGNMGMTAIVAGGSHTCAIKNGSIYCWGQGTWGQLGAGYANYAYAPVLVADGQFSAGNHEISAIVLGNEHTCALQFGSVYCWGYGYSGQLGVGYLLNYQYPARVWSGQMYAGNTDLTSISAGANHTCALKEGVIYCWGSGGQGQTGTDDWTTKLLPAKVADGDMVNAQVTTLASGGNHSCALKNGSIFCWGSGATGELGNGSTSAKPVPTQVMQNSFAGEETGIVGISLGLYHSCAVFVAGNGYCWGGGTETTPSVISSPQNQNEYGAYIHPALVPDTYTNLRIAVSDVSENSVQIFLSFNGKSFVSYGFLKPGTGITEIDLPAYMSPFSLQWGFEFAPNAEGSVLAVFAENTAIPTQTTNGMPFVLSKNAQTFLSGETYDIGTHPISPLTDLVTISLDIENMGENSFPITASTFVIDGQNGEQFSIASSSFAVLEPGASGELHIEATTTKPGINTARLRYYLGNADEQYILNLVGIFTDAGTALATTTFITDDTIFDTSTGIALTDASGITDVQIGANHACGLKDGIVYCWGANTFGQLGNGTTDATIIPIQVSDGEIPGGNTGLSAIAVGDTHTCVLKDGVAYCWGSAYLGQIGDGSPIYQYGLFKSTPTKVAGGSMYQGNKDLTAIAAGSGHSCVIKKSIDGLLATVYCWGRNDSGQLGTWNGQHSNVPTYLSYGEMYDGTVGVDALKLGAHHSCARKNGSLYCWGLNSSGQLGIGTTEYYVPYPKKVTTGELPEGNVNISSFDVGSYHSCAVASGKVYCWGANWQKQLGIDNESSYIPRQVLAFPSDVSALDVALGESHSCAHTVEHTVYCWGNNNYGQLGNGNQNIAVSQIPVPVVDKNGSALSFDMIMTGSYHTCGIYNGSLSCSGLNGNGELGIGTKNGIPYSTTALPSIFGTAVFSMTLAPEAFTNLSFFGQDIASNNGISVKIGTNGKATIPLGSFKSGSDVRIFDLQPFLNTISPLTIEITFNPSESGRITHLYVEKKIIPGQETDTIAPIVTSLTLNPSTPTAGQPVLIDASGQDNLGIKAMEFFVYIPSLGTWESIAMAGSADGSHVYTQWLVPDEWSGSGFMLKALAWDIGNNASPAFVHEPFAITQALQVDANPPTISSVVVNPSVIVDKADYISIVAQINDDVKLSSATYYYTDYLGQNVLGTLIDILAQDGIYETNEESISFIIDTSAWTFTKAPYTIYLSAEDSAGNSADPIVIPVPFESTTDTDEDGIVDMIDNCVLVANDMQTDYDEDGTGDACDLPPGDITGDNVINVVDVQCAQLLALWQLNKQDNPMPVCLSSGLIEDADVNCDGSVNVIDVQQLINIALMLSCNLETGSCKPVLVTDIDADHDNIHNQCEK